VAASGIGADDNIFDIVTGHGAGDDADFRISCMTASSANACERWRPGIGIDLYDCDSALIENCAMRGFRTALVQIDSDCDNVMIRGLRDSRAVSGIVTDETIWTTLPHPPQDVVDSGTNTKILNHHVYDPTARDYTGNPDAVQVFEETDGVTHKTTLVLHDKQMTITDDGVGYGAELLYTFPVGHILVLGVVVDANIDASDQYDTDTNYDDDGEGDFSVGTTGTSDTTLDGTDVNLIASTAFTLSAAGETGALDGDAIASDLFDGTGGAITVYLNALADDADLAGNAIVAFQGTITIHWIELGDN